MEEFGCNQALFLDTFEVFYDGFCDLGGDVGGEGLIDFRVCEVFFTVGDIVSSVFQYYASSFVCLFDDEVWILF